MFIMYDILTSSLLITLLTLNFVQIIIAALTLEKQYPACGLGALPLETDFKIALRLL